MTFTQILYCAAFIYFYFIETLLCCDDLAARVWKSCPVFLKILRSPCPLTQCLFSASQQLWQRLAKKLSQLSFQCTSGSSTNSRQRQVMLRHEPDEELMCQKQHNFLVKLLNWIWAVWKLLFCFLLCFYMNPVDDLFHLVKSVSPEPECDAIKLIERASVEDVERTVSWPPHSDHCLAWTLTNCRRSSKAKRSPEWTVVFTLL